MRFAAKSMAIPVASVSSKWLITTPVRVVFKTGRLVVLSVPSQRESAHARCENPRASESTRAISIDRIYVSSFRSQNSVNVGQGSVGLYWCEHQSMNMRLFDGPRFRNPGAGVTCSRVQYMFLGTVTIRD